MTHRQTAARGQKKALNWIALYVRLGLEYMYMRLYTTSAPLRRRRSLIARVTPHASPNDSIKSRVPDKNGF
jgi:hypothetical protein